MRKEKRQEESEKKAIMAVEDAVDITGSASAVMFDRFEDDVFMQHCSAAVLFTPRGGSSSGGGGSSSSSSGSKRKTVLLMSVEGWQKSSKDLLNLLPDTSS